MRAKTLPPGEYGPEQGMRPNTSVRRWEINFFLKDGGMGDLVNYAAATQWVAKNVPWVRGKLFCPAYLVGLMKLIHEVNPEWMVLANTHVAKNMEKGTAMIGPSIHINGVNTNPQLLTSLGAHPLDVGFAYYAGTAPPPAGAELPMLDLPRHRLNSKVRRLDRYAVITTGTGFESRGVSGRHINPIIEYVRSLGLTPVFLGKSDLLGDGQTITRFADDIAYGQGLDLRNQTSVVDAACIMQHAALTVGLDNGLLHLAALMRDSRIVFGYNITSIADRAPRRSWGKTVNVALTPAELICSGCQSRWKHVPLHQFDRCYYGDNLCIEMLFSDGAARWKAAIDEVLA